MPDLHSVADLILHLRISSPVAVVLNDTIVPRAGWPLHMLHEDDRVELLTFAGGG